MPAFGSIGTLAARLAEEIGDVMSQDVAVGGDAAFDEQPAGSAPPGVGGFRAAARRLRCRITILSCFAGRVVTSPSLHRGSLWPTTLDCLRQHFRALFPIARNASIMAAYRLCLIPAGS
jgi:hypothetical protein